MTDEHATAYHEAGHAVAALARGRPVTLVTIVPDEQAGSAGHCIMPSGPTDSASITSTLCNSAAARP